MVDDILCTVIKIINVLTSQVGEWIIDILIWCLTLLPETPFQFEPIKWGAFGNAVGYFIPISSMMTHLAFILSALLVWYAVQHIVRVLKIIR